MVLKEVIAYYSTHGSLYCTMLDATKAFDRVDYCQASIYTVNVDSGVVIWY